jgi:MFS/sugar transport protein
VTLSLRTKLLYGTSRIGSEALGRSQGLWLLYYYAPPSDAHLPTLLPSLAVGALLTVGGIVGALDEAIVGYFSDRTRSRWGRRIPYIVLGAPLWSIFFLLVFTPPPNASDAATAVYVFFMFEALALFGAVVVGPYEALLPEMAPTSNERVGVQAVKVYLGVLGTAIGLVGSDFLVHHVGFKAMALTVAAFALVCQYVAIGGVWRRAQLSRVPAEIGFRDALRATLPQRGVPGPPADGRPLRAGVPTAADGHPVLRARRRRQAQLAHVPRAARGRDRGGDRLRTALLASCGANLEAARIPVVDTRGRRNLPAARARGRPARHPG